MSTPSALHSKKTPKWGTPEEIGLLARVALGGEIHLDPASSPEFNQRIGAIKIITEAQNGLTTPWSLVPGDLDPLPGEIPPLSVFLNPPGGLVKEFWARLVQHYCEGLIHNAIWIGFSVEQLCILQDIELYPMDFRTVILRKRLAFTQENGTPGGSPSHGNYITGLGIGEKSFAECFGDLGRIVAGAYATP
jgi:hypothetical protein